MPYSMMTLPGDPPLPCAIARPEGDGDWPGVIVLMEVFGLNEHIRGITARLAEEGLIAIAPDLYCREGAGSVADYASFEQARAMRSRMSDQQALEDIGRCARYLLETSLVTGPIGTLGFCMGGRLSFLAACANHLPIHRAVSYYGTGIGAETPPTGAGNLYPPQQAGHLKRPVLCHFGATDQMIPPSEIGRIATLLAAAHVDSQVCVYGGAGHAFNNDQRPNYVPAAAGLAWGRTLEFLRAR